MNHLIRTCKCHWEAGENLHWGRTAAGGSENSEGGSENSESGAGGGRAEHRGSERRAFAPPGTAPQFAPDAPVTSRHLRLALHLDFDGERAWGATTHTLEAHAAQVQRVAFDAVSLEVAGVRVNGRRAAFANDGRAVTVELPRALTRGQSCTVELEHSVTRPVAGLYFTTPDPAYPQRFRTVWSQGQDEDSRYYFPCLDAPRFKQTSEALLYVPEGLFALSNGERVAHRARAGHGESLWHYRLDIPYSTYLFSIVAGDFAEHRTRGRGGVEVRWYVQRGREREGRNAFGNTPDMLRFLAGFTGVPYPHKQYTQIAVPDFIFGGMENFTVTTQTDLTLHDDRAHLDFSSDDLVAHEAAHTWFGNLVTARDWAHAWLHESFATYLEALYQRESRGDDEFDYQVLRDAEAYFHEDGQYRRPIVTQRYEAPIDLFDAHLYPGGAVRLRNLHALLGDAVFRAALRRYLEAHRCGLAETSDLARAVETEAGANWDWWFEQWIHAAGYPRLEIGYSWNAEEKLAQLTVKQTAPLTDPLGDPKAKRWFKLPVKLAFEVGRRVETFPVTLEGESQRLVFRLPGKPTMVLFDPDYECPVKHVKFDKGEDLLLRQLAHAPRPIARIEAAGALADKPSAKAVAALRQHLRREPFWGVQQRIARALGKIGGQAARDALLAARNLTHPKARREVVATLGHFKDDPRVADALLRAARRGDGSYYVEAELVRALGRCRAGGAQAVLRDYLGRDSHAEVIRSGALDALAEQGEAESWPVVAEHLRYGAPALSRPAAIRAAVELARRHPHLRQPVLDALATVAEHRDNPAAAFRGKMAALRALVRLGEADGLPVLQRVAANAVDGRVVRLARLCTNDLRQALSKPQELHTLRTDLDQLGKENKGLRERVQVLEQKSKPAKSTGARKGRAVGRKR
jgi:aminopeptidase N